MHFAARISLLVAALAAVSPAAATAAPTPVEPAELGEWPADTEIKDTVLRPGVRARAAASRSETFVDDHGHVITIETDLPGLVLEPYARVFAALRHYDEIEDVVIEVVTPQDVAPLCGGPGVLACYQPARGGHGRIWIPTQDPSLLYIMVHEYGHHVDNQLINLGQLLGNDCYIDGDGSRNWFFERDTGNRISRAGIECAIRGNWNYLLAELYAEDYTRLNGNPFWRSDMPIGPPTNAHLEAMADDFAAPLEPRQRRYTKRVRHRRARFVSFRVRDWTLFTAALRGPRSADLDLYLFEGGARRPFAGSRKGASKELIQQVLPPGRYRVAIYAADAGGRGRLRLFMD